MQAAKSISRSFGIPHVVCVENEDEENVASGAARCVVVDLWMKVHWIRMVCG